MTIENAKDIKQKIELISAAAQEYSDSAKLFDKAKNDISTLADSNKEQSEKMQKLISRCDDYLSSARNLIDNEYTSQLETVTQKAKEAIEENGEKCQEVINSANATQKLIEDKLEQFEQKLAKMEKQNKLFSYVGFCLGGLITLLIIIGIFI